MPILDAPPVDTSAFPDPDTLRRMPLEERAAVVRDYMSPVQARAATLLNWRLEAGVALHLQHGWPGARIYHRYGVPRRTFTSWLEDGRGRDLPQQEEWKDVADGDAADTEYKALAPVLEQLSTLRTDVYRTLRRRGVPPQDIMDLTGMTPDRLRIERRRAKAAGLTFPRPKSDATKTAAKIRRRITSGKYPPGGMLPGEHQLATEYRVGRTVIEGALQQLRDEGLVVSRPKVGWFVVDPQDKAIAEIDQVTEEAAVQA